MKHRLQNHLDRRAFLASAVASAFTLGVAGRMGLPAALAEPVRRTFIGVDFGSSRSISVLVRLATDAAGKPDWNTAEWQVEPSKARIRWEALDAKLMALAGPAGSVAP